LLYLKNRYEKIYKECKNRNFNVTYYGDTWDNLPEDLMNEYIPSNKDREIVKERIRDRLK
jgi:hypothetical protein